MDAVAQLGRITPITPLEYKLRHYEGRPLFPIYIALLWVHVPKKDNGDSGIG